MMTKDPWYKVVTLRREVREGRSFSPDEFAIALEQVVSDRRATLDEAMEIRPAIRKLVEQEFSRGANLPIIPFPEDGASIQDNPRLTLVVVDPEVEWQRVFLLTRARSDELQFVGIREHAPPSVTTDQEDSTKDSDPEPESESIPPADMASDLLRITGTVPPELRNRLGTKLIPKLRAGDSLTMGVNLTVELAQTMAESLQADVQQVLSDLNLTGCMTIQRSTKPSRRKLVTDAG